MYVSRIILVLSLLLLPVLADAQMVGTTGVPAAVISENNSSVIPLGANQTFTGSADLIDNYAAVNFFVLTDVAGTLNVQFSPDGTHWDITLPAEILPNVDKEFALDPIARYFRVVLINGPAPQTFLRMQVRYHAIVPAIFITTLEKPITHDVPAAVTHSVVAGQVGGAGAFTNVAVSTAGHMLVDTAPGVPADTVGTTTALGALNATCQVSVVGKQGASAFIAAGTLNATIVPEISYDSGSNWQTARIYDSLNDIQASSFSFVGGGPNSATGETIILHGGVTDARFRVSVYTSGTANCTMRATSAADSPSVVKLAAGNSLIGSVTTGPDSSGSGVVVAALNDYAYVSMSGLQGAGMTLIAGTLAATVTPEVSFNNRVNWVATKFFDLATNTTPSSFVFTNPNPATFAGILVPGGATDVRVRVSSYTSGSTTILIRATTAQGGMQVVQGAGSTKWLVDGSSSAAPYTVNNTQQGTASANLSQINGVAGLAGNGTTGTGSQRVTIASDNTAFSVNATPPTLTKGTQGSTGYGVQELHDAGRTLVTLTADAVTPAASDTLVTVAKLVGDTVTSGVTTYPVTSGKTLRLTNLSLQFTASAATAAKVRIRLRTLSSGTCIATSPLVGTWELALPTGTLAAAQGQGVLSVDFPEGVEFSGATRNICFSAIASTSTGTLTITLTGYEY